MRSVLRHVSSLLLLALCVVASARMIAADRGEADLGIATALTIREGLPVKNDPPRLLFSKQSAILILIDGDPVYRPIDGTDLQRIINTKPFIVRDEAGIHYLKLFDGWVEAYTLNGIWSVAGVPPRGAEQALQLAVGTKTVDLLDGATPGRASAVCGGRRHGAGVRREHNRERVQGADRRRAVRADFRPVVPRVEDRRSLAVRAQPRASG